VTATPKSSFGGVEKPDSMSKSKPSTLAAPKGLGPVQSDVDGPKAPQRKSAKCAAVVVFLKYWFVGNPPPRESRTFFPASWHAPIPASMLGQLLSSWVAVPSAFE